MDPTKCNGIKYKLEVSIPKLVNTSTLLLEDGATQKPLPDIRRLQQDTTMARLGKKARENKVNELSQKYQGNCPWKVYYDETNKADYYYNRVTKETTWEKPIDLKWQSKKDKDGDTFYYNEDIDKNTSTWEKPDCFDIKNND